MDWEIKRKLEFGGGEECKPFSEFSGEPGGQNPWKINNVWFKASMIGF